MKRTITLAALLSLALALSLSTGCGEKAEAKAECVACGSEFDKADACEVDGKTLCPHCAEAAPAADETAMHECGKCGMKMAASEMVEQDGQWFCSHCSPAEDHEHDEHEGHDHG
ncbi:hypothetical protein H8E07_06730 [bacterium]|nr:hypothetical protein [bacterium]